MGKGHANQKTANTNIADQLRTVRTEITSLESGHQARMRDLLAGIYRSAMRLREDNDEWLSFCRDPEWVEKDYRMRPKHNDPDDALRCAIRLAVGFNGPADNRRVYDLRRSLAGFFDDRVPASEIRKHIEKGGGITKLRNKKPAASAHSPQPLVMNLRLPLNGRKREEIMTPGALILVQFDESAKPAPKIVIALPLDRKNRRGPCNTTTDTQKTNSTRQNKQNTGQHPQTPSLTKRNSGKLVRRRALIKNDGPLR